MYCIPKNLIKLKRNRINLNDDSKMSTDRSRVIILKDSNLSDYESVALRYYYITVAIVNHP